MNRIAFKYLKVWKNSNPRKPLLVRGARQVGKSYTIREFGKREFTNFLEVNLELHPELHKIFEIPHPKEILKNLELYFNQKINSDTLLFFDEVQECPKAISSLRYFFELTPEIPIIACGSLVEFVLNTEKLSIPVGRIQYMFFYPMSFLEFLEAIGEVHVLEAIQTISISKTFHSVVHEKLLKLYKDYIYIGGMPEAVQNYINSKNFTVVKQIQTSLLQTFRDDFGKYANLPKHKYLYKVLYKAPALIGKNLKYSAIDKETPSRDIKDALEMLGAAGLIHKIKAVSTPQIPLSMFAKDKQFKIAMLDIGLAVRSIFLDYPPFEQINIAQTYLGLLSEQFVIQELFAYNDMFEKTEFYYWKRDKKGSSAEIDLLLNYKNKILPIEIKSGKTGTLKSLQIYNKEYKPKVALRFSEQPISYYEKILSIPFYLISQVRRLLDEVL